MGIQYLNTFLKNNTSYHSIKKIELEKLSNKVISVDISIYLYRFLAEEALLENMYIMLSLFRYYNIIPIFVFDGKAPVEKAKLLERRAMEKELSELQKKIAMGGNISSDKKVEDLNGIKFVGKVLNGIPAKELRSLADEAKMRIGSGVISFITVNDGKVAILTAVTEDLIKSVSAVDLARVGSIAVGGKGGGGRADMAQAGGPNGMEADKALEAIKNYLSLLKNL